MENQDAVHYSDKRKFITIGCLLSEFYPYYTEQLLSIHS